MNSWNVKFSGYFWNTLTISYQRFCGLHDCTFSYWNSIFTLYLTWGAFSLVCVLSNIVFFFFVLSVFSLLDTNDSQDSRKRRGNHCFTCFPFTNIHLVHQDFYHFFYQSICNYQTASLWDLFSLEICILFAFSLVQLSRSYWLHISKLHCEDLTSYQIITLLLQSERLTLTLLVTTVYLYTYPTLHLATAYLLSVCQNV